ncbi:hypothetical protein KFE25_001506 [Diacronema lutheri]|uniref:EF-hand domain-containing protein n=1 Tax=Diacronema lutheri TaxID=2081491 RepID=A0A8J6C283_DIALT|nr:hypothetical protein KFE25_001506 [Diacronema lutheri]
MSGEEGAAMPLTEVRTRAPDPTPVKKKPFSKRSPSLRSLMTIPAEPTGLSDKTVERKDRDKPDTIAAEHVEKLLEDMDENNNGVVERDEFRRYVKRMEWPLTDEKIDAMFTEADGNGDGRLDFRELSAAASGRFKQRVHKQEWFSFLSTVAEMLAGTQNVFELPIDPPMQVEVQDGADMAPDILTYRPRRFSVGEPPSDRSPGSRRPDSSTAKSHAARDQLFVVPPKASAKPNAAVAIATLDSFAPIGGGRGARPVRQSAQAAMAAIAAMAINQEIESKVSLSDRAEVRQFYPPPERDDSPRRAFDMSAALGRSMAPVLGSRYAVSFESTRTFDAAVRGQHERSERASSWPEPRPAHTRDALPHAPPPRQLRELVGATRTGTAAGDHYVPATRDTTAVRRDGVMRGGIDDETQPWQPLRLAVNEGITPSLELLERRRTGGRPIAHAAERVAADARARLGFTLTSLLHKPLSPQQMRALAAADKRRADGSVEWAPPRPIDLLNGKPSAHAFRDEPLVTARVLDASGAPDMRLGTRPPPTAQFARETLRGGEPLRLQLTQNVHPASTTKAPSGLIRGEWTEHGRTRSAGARAPAGEAGGGARAAARADRPAERASAARPRAATAADGGRTLVAVDLRPERAGR